MDDPLSDSDAESSDIGLLVTPDSDRTEVEQPDPSGAREVPALPCRLLLVSDLIW